MNKHYPGQLARAWHEAVCHAAKQDLAVFGNESLKHRVYREVSSTSVSTFA